MVNSVVLRQKQAGEEQDGGTLLSCRAWQLGAERKEEPERAALQGRD